MAYGENEDANAADELDDKTAENGSDEHTFFLPPDCAQALEGMGVKLEPGTDLPFKVVGKDKDGNVEVGYSKPDENEDWGKDLENNMPSSMGGNMQEQQ